MHLLEAYLRDLREIHFSGAGLDEPSSYPAVRELLNGVGKDLEPPVRCIIQLKNKGAGIPDGGLFTPDQLPGAAEHKPLLGLMPARGAIEVKGAKEDIHKTALSKQVRSYLDRYGQVFVTNLWEFVLVERGDDGRLALGESFRLADSEAAFWAATADARAVANELGEQFEQYLRGVLLRPAPLGAPKELAFFLASYARAARVRMEHRDLSGLQEVRTALEEALGLHFEGERGEHFFRSTFVQTLFYGVFSAWVLWSKQHPADDKAVFDWRMAMWLLRVPAIQVLFEQVAVPSRLKPLGLDEILDWTGAALNRVDRTAFFARFEEDHAVQYFYEPFLEEFDPELRKELGVWYTPPEIVRYMVARVDVVLRRDLGIPDGLADQRVHVLDPCTGTGSYLVEVLKRIAATLAAKGEDALLGEDLKQAAMERIHGFEILPAPFVVAHLQLGLLLQHFGASLSTAKQERVSVYLTNALTGWDPPTGPKARLMFPELAAERDRAEHVKREQPILVVLGNPPYNAFAGVSPQEEEDLVAPYKVGLNRPIDQGGWGIRKFNLDDLYVRFFRIAERRIAEQTGQGIVCFISNFSYLSDPSFVVMRERFLSEFDVLWFDSLNGDSRETGKRTPDGKPDPSVFSTEYNPAGIRLGTAVGLMVRKKQRAGEPIVRYRDFWGTTKREDLVKSLEAADLDGQYQVVRPERGSRFSFRPMSVADHYMEWPKLVDLAGDDPISGLQEMRKGALMGIDPSILEERMQQYLDPSVDWEALEALGIGLTAKAGRFDPKEARRRVLDAERFDPARIVPYALYPMDQRWAYYSAVRPLWNEPRPALVAQHWPGNRFLVTRPVAERPTEHAVMTATTALPDYHLLRPNAVAIPMRLRRMGVRPQPKLNQIGLEWDESTDKTEPMANLSPGARAYLAELGLDDPDDDTGAATAIWYHALAIGFSPAYLSENADGIRQDFPRVPLPEQLALLQTSAELGRHVAALLDTAQEVVGVTAGAIRPELLTLGLVTQTEPGELDRIVSADWGRVGEDGIIMPGSGRVLERELTPDERSLLDAWGNPLGLSGIERFAPLGMKTYDVYLNDRTYWRNVPQRVWEYRIGGYQVIKKWLAYRAFSVIRRPLTVEEVRAVQKMTRRIAAILLLEPKLDANYEAVKVTAQRWDGARIAKEEALRLW